MNYSGILVVTTPEQFSTVCDNLNNHPGTEVFHLDEPNSRLIAVQEAETINDEVSGLKAIKQIPGIVMAEMVQHYFGDDKNCAEPMPDDLDEMAGLVNTVPAFLNND